MEGAPRPALCVVLFVLASGNHWGALATGENIAINTNARPADQMGMDVKQEHALESLFTDFGETSSDSSSSNDIDWSQCKSEGGSGECARCTNSGGLLPCGDVGQYTDGGGLRHKHSTCKDKDMTKNGRFFIQRRIAPGKNKAECRPFSHIAALTGMVDSTFKFPGVDGNGGKAVTTKAYVTHPDQAAQDTGVIMFKRIVQHNCTSAGDTAGACTLGTQAWDVWKWGYCIKCPDQKFYGGSSSTRKKTYKCKSCNNSNRACSPTCKIFSHTTGTHTDDLEREAFVKDCFRYAFTSSGGLKDSYKCDDADADIAEATMAAF